MRFIKNCPRPTKIKIGSSQLSRKLKHLGVDLAERRGRPVDIEIVKLDRGADKARGQDAPMLSIGCQFHAQCPFPD